MQFLQDYSFIQTTVLSGVEGSATNTPIPCFAYSAACNNVPMTTHYGSAQNLVAAGQELEQVTNLFCDNGGVPCAGSYSSTSEWCVGGLGPGSGTCGAFKVFTPDMDYRKTLFRNLWGAAILSWGASIGLQISGRGPEGGGPATANCFNPHAADVETPGIYNPGTNYNSVPVWNSTAVAADTCDMLTYGFIASGPTLEGDILNYNSQTAGTGGISTGNVFDDPTVTSPADSVAGYASPQPHTTIYNTDFDTNNIEFATTAAQAYGASAQFMNAYALSIPTVFGYYENTLYVNNANGWTGFVAAPVTGPNELGGLYFTNQDAHLCGSATCTIGAANGGTLGGNLNVALENVADQNGLNTIYSSNWAWQADVFGSIYDTALYTPAVDFPNVNFFNDYMTTSHTITNIPSQVLGTGPTWYYYQQPCTSPLPAATYLTRLAACQGHSSPGQTPGPLQHGIGLGAAARTITNGQVISMTLKPGIYFYDGVQVTANDLEFSLNYYNIAGGPNLPDNTSPATATFAGPFGLIASQLKTATGLPCSLNCARIDIYVGSQSFWSLGSVITAVLPSHVFKYFNPDHTATVSFGTVDTSKPFGIAASAYSTAGAPHPSATSWMYYLPNLEIGSGPYYLSSWNGGAGTGVDAANPFYFNPNWQAEANVTQLSGSSTMSANLIIYEYNPTPVNINCGPAQPGPILPNSVGLCQITNALAGVGKVKIYDSSGLLWRNLKLTKNALTGTYSWTIPGPAILATKTGGACSVVGPNCYTMPAGQYYATLQTTYSYHGLIRTWYQIFGFTIS